MKCTLHTIQSRRPSRPLDIRGGLAKVAHCIMYVHVQNLERKQNEWTKYKSVVIDVLKYLKFFQLNLNDMNITI